MEDKWKDKWEKLQQQQLELQNTLRALKEELSAIAADELIQHLKQGEWKYTDYGGRLSPVDSKAECALVALLSAALELGYHDSFVLMDGAIYVEGFVSDGELTLRVALDHDLNKEDADAILKAIDVEIDLAELFEVRLKSQLEWEEQKLAKTQANIKRIKSDLEKLRKNE